MTHEELLHAFQSIKDITGPNVPVLIEYAINSDLSIPDCIRLREILSEKINEYKKSLIDKYQQAANGVARKWEIDILPIPDKHLKDIENRVKFLTINLCGNFNLSIAKLRGEDSSELERQQNMEMAVLKSLIFEVDNELKEKYYTLQGVDKEKRTHKKYITGLKKTGRSISDDVAAQLESLELLEEDLKEKNSDLLPPNASTIQKTTENRDFTSYLIDCDKTKVINNMVSSFHNCKGRDIALILRALEKLNFIILPQKGKAEIYRALFRLTGWDTSETSINNYLNNGTKDNVDEEEVIRYAEILNK